jgi:hypothetical protein
VVHQGGIVVRNEVDDTFVLDSGLEAANKIVPEGSRHLHDGDKMEYTAGKPEEGRAESDREK